MKAVLCPVCNGSGKIQPTGDQSDNKLETCHGCNGKGWVEVQEDYSPYVRYPIVPCEPYNPYCPRPVEPWYTGSPVYYFKM